MGEQQPSGSGRAAVGVDRVVRRTPHKEHMMRSRNIYRTNPATNLGIFLQELHDSEINGSIEWMFDRVWTARIGAPVLAEASFNTLGEAAHWMLDKVNELYPDSSVVKRWLTDA